MSDLTNRITINPNQCGGRPCIRGLRIRVVDVLDLLAAGLSQDQIIEELPDLESEDVRAAILYARGKIDHPDKVKGKTILDDGTVKEVIMKGSKDSSDAVAGSVYSILEETKILPVSQNQVRAFKKKVQQRQKEEDPMQNFLMVNNGDFISKDDIPNEKDIAERGRDNQSMDKFINLLTASGQNFSSDLFFIIFTIFLDCSKISISSFINTAILSAK